MATDYKRVQFINIGIGVGHGDGNQLVFRTSILYPERDSKQIIQFSLLIINLRTNLQGQSNSITKCNY